LLLLIGLVATAALTAPLSALAGEPDRPIRIGLGWGLSSARVSADSGLLVEVDGAVVLELAPGEAAELALAGGGIRVSGLAEPVPGPVRLIPAGEGFVSYKGRIYRGEIEVLRAGSGLSVVNVVDLEDYLLGVVPAEMQHSWPLEALKAQAVAARSFAVANLGRRQADGFDLRDNSDDQAYGGVLAEREATSEAVRLTAGEVVTYGGRVIATFYHASSGGHTENNEHIWTGGVPVPYLRGVPDYDDLPNNKWYRWSYRFSAAEFAEKLARAGYPVGELREVIAGPPSASGRPSSWTVVGSAGEARLTMQQMRSALGLPAPPSAIAADGAGAAPPDPPEPEPDPVQVVGAGGRAVSRQVAGSAVASAGGRVSTLPSGPVTLLGARGMALAGEAPRVPPPAASPAPDRQAAEVVVDGGGYGHGVGLSQYGAYGMALQGKTYKEILTHYFTGTQVEAR